VGVCQSAEVEQGLERASRATTLMTGLVQMPPNKALHPTANPLRGLSAAERNR